ncbi:type II restriction endonuclease [Gammaproteobacteria bacterium]|nr:type II restriction endonuclease [Gammaproteobacteria bacterium]
MELTKQTKNLTVEIRKKLIGSSEDANAHARDIYINEHGEITSSDITSNISNILSKFFDIQNKLFLETKGEIEGKWLSHVNTFENAEEKFPDYYYAKKRLEEILESNINNDNKIKSLLAFIAPMQTSLAISNSQSGKSRAGNAFESHLEYLFKKLDMKFGTQLTPSNTGGNEKFDFIFPSLERFEEIPNDCMLCEAQSTLKDRFRLTQGKANTVPTNRYLFTAGGAGIIRKNDVKDFTQDKLDELQSKGVTLVVLKKVKEENNHSILKSYEEFVSTIYPSQSFRWE